MRVSECHLSALNRPQREALLAVLSSLPQDEFQVIQNHQHGGAVMEWSVAASHPVLAVLPLPMTLSSSGISSPAIQQQRNHKPAVTPARPSEQKQHIINTPLMENASTGDRGPVVLRGTQAASAPWMAPVSAAAAASRKGASARRRSVSRSPSPLRRTAAGLRSLTWTIKLIDELMTFTKKMRIDRTRVTNVEELIRHVIATRFGITPTHKRLFEEVTTAAHYFSDLSPLCLLFHTYVSKRAVEDLGEFVMLCGVLAALVPWCTIESVKTVRQDATQSSMDHLAAGFPLSSQQRSRVGVSEAHVALRRYLAETDIPVALREAINVMVPRGSFVTQGELRQYMSRWLRSRNPPIAFDFAGHVDVDAVAMMLAEGLREAKANLQRVGAEEGLAMYLSEDVASAVPFDHTNETMTQYAQLSKTSPNRNVTKRSDGSVQLSSPLRYQTTKTPPPRMRRTLTPSAAVDTAASSASLRQVVGGATTAHNTNSSNSSGRKGAPLIVSVPPREKEQRSDDYSPNNLMSPPPAPHPMVTNGFMGRSGPMPTSSTSNDAERVRNHGRPRREEYIDPYSSSSVDMCPSTPPPVSISTESRLAAGSPLSPAAAASLQDMRATLSAIENELRRRQESNGVASSQRKDVSPSRHGRGMSHAGSSNRPEAAEDEEDLSPTKFLPAATGAGRKQNNDFSAVGGGVHSSRPSLPLAPTFPTMTKPKSKAITTSAAHLGLGEEEEELLRQLESSLRARREEATSHTTNNGPDEEEEEDLYGQRPLEAIATAK